MKGILAERIIAPSERGWLQAMRRLKTFLVGLLLMGLAGCMSFSSNKPLIGDDQAAFPFDPYAVVAIALAGENSKGPFVLRRKGNDYLALAPGDSANQMKFRFVRVAGDDYVVQYGPDSDGSYSFVAARVDLQGKRIALFNASPTTDEVAQIDSVEAFAKLIRAAVASGTKPDPTYDILATLSAPGSLHDGLAAYQRGDYVMALAILEPLAAYGSTDAQVVLGVMYDAGKGVPQDDNAAAKLYRQAADAGNAQAQNNLGVMYEKGRGVDLDFAEAAKWYGLAAAQGFEQAKKNLSELSAARIAAALALAKVAKLHVDREMLFDQRAADAGLSSTIASDVVPVPVPAPRPRKPSPKPDALAVAPNVAAAEASLAAEPVKDLCNLALNPAWEAWDTSGGWAEYVAEAQRRNLSIDDCRAAVGLPKPLSIGATADRLTADELDGLRSRLVQCWDPPPGFTDPAQVRVILMLNLNRDGSFGNAEVLESPQGQYSNSAPESAVRAVRRCAPYNLPPEKYDAWKQVRVTFEPRDMGTSAPPDSPNVAAAEAGRLCNSALNMDRDDWNTGSAYEDLVAEAKRRNLSIDDCRVAVGLPKLSEVAASDRATCAKVENPDASIPACTSIIDAGTETNENLASAYYNRGNVYMRKGDYDRAIADLSDAIQRKPDLADAYLVRGAAFDMKGDHDRAVVDFDKDIQLKPDDGHAHFDRGLAYDANGDSAKALEDFRAAARLLPTSDPFYDKARKRIAELEAQPAPQPPASAPTVVETPQPPAPTGGATIKVEKTTVHDGSEVTFVSIDGPLVLGDEKRFAEFALGVPEGAVVVLSSPGGNLIAGIGIGRAINLLGFRTLVPEGFQCASACAFAWLAGSPRLMGKGATIGFHAASSTENGTVSSVGNALVGAYLNQLGLPSSAIVYITEPQPNDIRWLTFDDAAQIGIAVLKFPAS
jgi:tetratricopeptide (TPR) repeat protein